MAVVAVDPAQLRRAAEQIQAVADRIGRAAPSRPSGFTVPGQRGWQTPGHLTAAVGGWADHLGDLVAGLAALAADLNRLADLFRAADRGASELASAPTPAAAVTSVGSPTPRASVGGAAASARAAAAGVAA